jgi:CRISPR-associated Csx11 family protein
VKAVTAEMPNSLKALSMIDDDLLLAEVGVWLHMLGKYQKQFLIENPKISDEKLPLEIYPDIDNSLYLERFRKLNEIFQSLMKAPFPAEKYSFLNLIAHHRKSKEIKTFVEKLLFDAHGRGSGTDKGILLDKNFKNQTGDKIFFASAFGWEKAIDLKMLEEKREILYEVLQQELINILSFQNWGSWRNGFLNFLKENFSQTIAETRLPINDVSLWDQTASTVAFFKVLLADAILLEKNKDINPLEETHHARFRVLQVLIGGMDYLVHSARIADFQKRKELIAKGFNRVKNLLEVEYPLGYEIYRDADRIAFLVPDKQDLMTITDGGRSLKDLIIEHFNDGTGGEIRINAIGFSGNGSRNVFYIGEELRKLPGCHTSTFDMLRRSWQDRFSDKCSICQMRPQELKKQKICRTCEERLVGRGEKWLTEQLNQTIWLDEVADGNGRVALVVGNFDLSKWQNGEMISTFRNPKGECKVHFSDLVGEFHIKDGQLTDQKLKKLNKYREIAKTHAESVQKLYGLQVKTEDLGGNAYQKLSLSEKLALAIWRKPPSFARINRVWNTTQTFWREIIAELDKTVEYRPTRVKINVNGDINSFSEYNTYIAETSAGIRFTVTYAGQGTLYIGENLSWLAKKMGARREEISEYGEAACYVCDKLRESNETNFYAFEAMDQKIDKLSREQIKITRDDKDYLPIIEVLAEPKHFMAFVPADQALAVAEKIRSKFCREMGKVRNRLPFNLGLIFAPSHTPLMAMLDAGRRMINIKMETEEWTLEEKQEENIQTDSGKQVIQSYQLNFDNGQVWKIPASMGDQTTEDIWHPNFYVSQDKEGQEPSARTTAFKGPDGWLINVKELERHDKVKVTPARFDFEFLDSAARRFEISYHKYQDCGKMHRRGNEGSPRPYYLDQLPRFEELKTIITKCFNRSQIYQIIQLIETKRTEWGQTEPGTAATFERFVKDTFRNAQWKQRASEEILKRLQVAAISGELRDVIELYFQILKCNFEGERM